MSKVSVTVAYDAEMEKRGGEMFCIVTRTQTETPVSGRGREWQQRNRERTVSVIPVDEAADLAKAVVEALAWAAKQGEVAERAEPEWAILSPEDRSVVKDGFWSYAEAEVWADAEHRGYLIGVKDPSEPTGYDARSRVGG